MENVNVKRNSNLELFRIVSMLGIVAHHFVINSNIIWEGASLYGNVEANTIYLLLFGMWGKIGINCFMLITGYFMCKSQISLRKFVKLMGQIYFYNVVIYLILLYVGKAEFSLWRLKDVVLPIWGLTSNFTSCFIVFWLTIPFWNVLIHHISKRQHLYLMALLVGCYSILASIPVREGFPLNFNYVSWFGIIYLIASYIRLYPLPVFGNTRLWGFLALAAMLLSMLSVVWLHKTKGWNEFFYVMDSNKILAVVVAVTSFLWFKNLNIAYNKWVNLVGGGTFGVLLIHANCEEVIQFLWYDFLDCIHKYHLPVEELVLYSSVSVLAVFVVCTVIDVARQQTMEKYFLNWFDKKYNKQL